MNKVLLFLTIFTMAGMPLSAIGQDNDMDNDGVWDNIDNDMDNDGIWDQGNREDSLRVVIRLSATH